MIHVFVAGLTFLSVALVFSFTQLYRRALCDKISFLPPLVLSTLVVWIFGVISVYSSSICLLFLEVPQAKYRLCYLLYALATSVVSTFISVYLSSKDKYFAQDLCRESDTSPCMSLFSHCSFVLAGGTILGLGICATQHLLLHSIMHVTVVHINTATVLVGVMTIVTCILCNLVQFRLHCFSCPEILHSLVILLYSVALFGSHCLTLRFVVISNVESEGNNHYCALVLMVVMLMLCIAHEVLMLEYRTQLKFSAKQSNHGGGNAHLSRARWKVYPEKAPHMESLSSIEENYL